MFPVPGQEEKYFNHGALISPLLRVSLAVHVDTSRAA